VLSGRCENTRQTSPEQEPLKLTQTYDLPAGVKGNFDHFEVDLRRHRLFATPEDYKAVLIFDTDTDTDTGKLIHEIHGIFVPMRFCIERMSIGFMSPMEAMDQ
jgi:hypothetical protein